MKLSLRGQLLVLSEEKLLNNMNLRKESVKGLATFHLASQDQSQE